jgi:hypothetical protein
MIICFENISKDKNFDRIYLCTDRDIPTVFREIRKIGLDELTDPDGFDGDAFEDPFMLSYIYAN